MGYIISGIKVANEVEVGDTIIPVSNSLLRVLRSCWYYPGQKITKAFTSMEKLQLNGLTSLTFEPESSAALGFGFRCGFLGILHMEIIKKDWSEYILLLRPCQTYHIFILQRL